MARSGDSDEMGPAETPGSSAAIVQSSSWWSNCSRPHAIVPWASGVLPHGAGDAIGSRCVGKRWLCLGRCFRMVLSEGARLKRIGACRFSGGPLPWPGVRLSQSFPAKGVSCGSRCWGGSGFPLSPPHQIGCALKCRQVNSTRLDSMAGLQLHFTSKTDPSRPPCRPRRR